jgi:hypothetical protein
VSPAADTVEAVALSTVNAGFAPTGVVKLSSTGLVGITDYVVTNTITSLNTAAASISVCVTAIEVQE